MTHRPRPRRSTMRPKSYPQREPLPVHLRETEAERLERVEAWWLTVVAPETRPRRPETRGDCEPGGFNEARPCPYFTCRYNLAYDVHPETGSLKANFPDRELAELPATCALDVAHAGAPIADGGDGRGRTLDEVGDYLNIGRERVRQVELAAQAKLRALVRTEETQWDEPRADDGK